MANLSTDNLGLSYVEDFEAKIRNVRIEAKTEC